jgi:nitroreductase
MSMTNPLQFLLDRRSVPAKQLGEPGPDEPALLQMLQTAARVPDHGKFTPFRFLRIAGNARFALGEHLAARAAQLDPHTLPAILEKDRARFASAPVVIAVVARPVPSAKVPQIEQFLCAGNVCFALLQAAQALGFGAQWLTGWAAYDEAIKRTLGVSDAEAIIGFIHIGTPKLQVPERERPNAATLLTDWLP